MSIDLAEVGALPSQDAAGNWRVRFGIYLPGITSNNGYRVQVRVIHERDQLVRDVEPKVFDLSWHIDSPLDLWNATVDLTAIADVTVGQERKYLYRFQLLRDDHAVTFWFADPFAARRSAAPFLPERVKLPLEQIPEQRHGKIDEELTRLDKRNSRQCGQCYSESRDPKGTERSHRKAHRSRRNVRLESSALILGTQESWVPVSLLRKRPATTGRGPCARYLLADHLFDHLSVGI